MSTTAYTFEPIVNLIVDDAGTRVEFDWLDSFNGQQTSDGGSISEEVDVDDAGYEIGARLMDDLLDRGIVPRQIEVA